MEKTILLMLSIVASLISASVSTPGTASFYTDYEKPSLCFGTKRQGDMVGAANDAIWNNGAGCGKLYNVKCTGPRNPGPNPCDPAALITVTIVDHCPGCKYTLNLSLPAFGKIARLTMTEIINIDYTEI